jgi:hypothetical protein
MLKFLKRFPVFPTANPVHGLKLCFPLKRHHTAEALSGAIFVAGCFKHVNKAKVAEGRTNDIFLTPGSKKGRARSPLPTSFKRIRGECAREIKARKRN